MVNDAAVLLQQAVRVGLDLPLRRPGLGVLGRARPLLPLPLPGAAAARHGAVVRRGRRARRALRVDRLDPGHRGDQAAHRHRRAAGRRADGLRRAGDDATARSRFARTRTARSAARTRPSPRSSTTTTSAARSPTRRPRPSSARPSPCNELNEWLKPDKPIHLVDVREPAEYEIVKIPGSVLIPKGDILSGQALADAAAGPPDRPVLQDRRPQRRGAGRGQGGRLQGRGARPRWRVRLGQRQIDPSLPAY